MARCDGPQVVSPDPKQVQDGRVDGDEALGVPHRHLRETSCGGHVETVSFVVGNSAAGGRRIGPPSPQLGVGACQRLPRLKRPTDPQASADAGQAAHRLEMATEPLAKRVIGRVFSLPEAAGRGTVSGRDAAFAGWQ